MWKWHMCFFPHMKMHTVACLLLTPTLVGGGFGGKPHVTRRQWRATFPMSVASTKVYSTATRRSLQPRPYAPFLQQRFFFCGEGLRKVSSFNQGARGVQGGELREGKVYEISLTLSHLTKKRKNSNEERRFSAGCVRSRAQKKREKHSKEETPKKKTRKRHGSVQAVFAQGHKKKGKKKSKEETPIKKKKQQGRDTAQCRLCSLKGTHRGQHCSKEVKKHCGT